MSLNRARASNTPDVRRTWHEISAAQRHFAMLTSFFCACSRCAVISLRSDAQMYIGRSPSRGEETIQQPAPGRPLFFWVKLRVGQEETCPVWQKLVKE